MGGWVLTVDAYVKFADLEDAGRLFDEMPE